MIRVEKLTMAERSTCIEALGEAVEELKNVKKVFDDAMLFWPIKEDPHFSQSFDVQRARLQLVLQGLDKFLLTWSLTTGEENELTNMLLDSGAQGCRASMLWDMLAKCQKELVSKGKSIEKVQALMTEVRQMDDVSAMTRCEELMGWPDEVPLGKDE
ncbi:MAG TPA: hypothetical protein DEQ85_08480 [Clostridiales bacterium]|nr:hypothetical protein [Clostridiales bacterium]